MRGSGRWRVEAELPLPAPRRDHLRHYVIAFASSSLLAVSLACSSEPISSDTPHHGVGGTSSGGTGSAGKKAGSGGNNTGSAGKKTGSGGAGAGAAGKGTGSGNQTGTGGASLAGSGGDGAGAGGHDGGAGGDDAGAGGDANVGGAGGEPACGNVLCGSACIDPQVRTQDQIALDMSGSVGLDFTQRPGESFTVGTRGLLTGIEVAVGPCNDADTTGQIKLELFNAGATSLGHVTIEQASLPTVCGGEQLLDGTIGAGYFDLTPLCVSAEAGDQFTFILSLLGGTAPTCDTNSHECSNNAHSCYDDNDCRGFYYVGDTNCGGYGCEGAISEYPGGSEVMQDVNTGALGPTPSFELAFKTFVH